MQVYRGLEPYLDGLAALYDRALRRGDATCLVATREVREGLRERLGGTGWRVDGPSGHQRYLAMDAADALSSIMRNSVPDPAAIARIAQELDLYRRTVASDSARLTVTGNMVALLHTGGQSAAAATIEHEWNTLTADLPFFTLCSYPAACFDEHASGTWSTACALHRSLSPTPDL
jgi:hypothetical protein